MHNVSNPSHIRESPFGNAVSIPGVTYKRPRHTDLVPVSRESEGLFLALQLVWHTAGQRRPSGRCSESPKSRKSNASVSRLVTSSEFQYPFCSGLDTFVLEDP